MHDPDETHTLAGHRTNEALVLSSVVNRVSQDVYAGSQCRFRDNPPRPDCSNQVVLADNPISVFDQVFKKIEDLRGDGNELRPTPQLAAVRVEHKVFEAVEQIAPPRPKTRHRPGYVSTSMVKK